MSGGLRLLAIETRRNSGLWCLPLMVAIAWFTADQQWQGEPVLWPQTSKQIASALIFLAPAGGGLAAWMAGRDRRRGVTDLLQSTPRSSALRTFTGWGATVIWIIAAYIAAGAFFAIRAARDATWGGPDVTPLLVGLMAVMAFAAMGYAAGTFAPSRFTAPLTAVGLFVLEALPLFFRSPPARSGTSVPRLEPAIHYFSPWAIVSDVQYSVFRPPFPVIGPAQIVWLLGLTGIALALAALHHHQSVIARGALVAGIAITIVGAVMLLGINGKTTAREATIPYTPVCATPSGGIPVCVHPAYASLLPRTADAVNAVLRPLIGIPGVPNRAEFPVEPDSTGALAIYPSDPPPLVARSTVGELIWHDRRFSDDTAPAIAAKNALSLWLLRQAGFGGSIADQLFSENPAVAAAADRLAALTPPDRRAWLEAHWPMLQANTLTLADLP